MIGALLAYVESGVFDPSSQRRQVRREPLNIRRVKPPKELKKGLLARGIIVFGSFVTSFRFHVLLDQEDMAGTLHESNAPSFFFFLKETFPAKYNCTKNSECLRRETAPNMQISPVFSDRLINCFFKHQNCYIHEMTPNVRKATIITSERSSSGWRFLFSLCKKKKTSRKVCPFHHFRLSYEPRRMGGGGLKVHTFNCNCAKQAAKELKCRKAAHF